MSDRQHEPDKRVEPPRRDVRQSPDDNAPPRPYHERVMFQSEVLPICRGID